MKITIQTPVNGNFKQVFAKFDKDLLTYLTPIFPPSKITHFEGSKLGNKVHLRLSFLLFSQDWVSEIVEEQITENQAYFTDKGIKLPFFLSDWRHKHLVKMQGKNSVIIDEIIFKTPFFLFDYLLYPIMFLQFYQRKPKYQQYFSSFIQS